MSTSSGAWNIPPPPGTMDESSSSCKRSSTDKGKTMRENYRRYSRSRSREQNSRSRSRSVSRNHHHHHHHRSKRSNRRRSRSRSSRDYRRRSRSRSYTPSHHKKHSRSRRHKYTRSRSRSHSRYHRRSRSYSRSRSRSLSSSSYSDRESSLYRKRRSKHYQEVPKDQNYIRKVYSKHTEVPTQENTFKNDGSFLEMFKKMQEEKAAEEKKTETPEASVSNAEVKKTLPIFGKRRGGKVLKTGMVQKLKNPTEAEEEPKDAWSMYMKEVKRYREACCDDDSKTRPLVK